MSEFVFAVYNDQYKSRKRSHRACVECKKRRKKCNPSEYEGKCQLCYTKGFTCSLVPEVNTETEKLSPPPPEMQPFSTIQSLLNPIIDKSVATVPIDELKKCGLVLTHDVIESTITKFIGDTDPTSILLDVVSKNKQFVDKIGSLSKTHRRDKEENRVGIWVKNKFSKRQSVPEQTFKYLQSIDAFSLGIKDQAALCEMVNVYFSRVNHYLPIIDEKDFRQMLSIKKVPTLLLYAVVLVGMKNRQYTQSNALENKIRALIPLENDKFTLLQVYSLLSFCGSDNDSNALDLSIAINYALSLGVHHDLSSYSRISNEKKISIGKTWWSLFILDRVFAAIVAKPSIIQEKDMSISWPVYDKRLHNLVKISVRLDKIFTLYAPNGNRKFAPSDLGKVLDYGADDSVWRLLYNVTVFLGREKSKVKSRFKNL